MLIRLKAKRNESMELDERKVRILKAIVSNYLETGEPVGSRTISKLADMNVSPATIRNEMSATCIGRKSSDGCRLQVLC